MVGGPPEDHLSDHIHQATGMVSAQVGCDISEALHRLIIRAAASGAWKTSRST
jgi:hypothetical protein